MPRRNRIQDSDAIYFVTNRTQEAKLLLVPDDAFNAIVMRRLRNAVRIFGIKLYAAVIMGNHFHLILGAPKMNLSEFMRYFQTYLSADVNKLRGRFDATVFPKRFSSEPIVDLESLKRMLCYTMLNPVAANLVEFPGQYPGYTSWHQHVGAPQPTRHTEEPPPITPPPMWGSLSEEELAEEWRALVKPGIIHYAKTRTRPVLGARKVRKMKWWKRPRRPKRSRRRPLCHARDKETWKRYARFCDRVQTQYREAVLNWREGIVTEFPHGTIPPGWSECKLGPRRFPPDFRLAAMTGDDEPRADRLRAA